MKEKNYIRRKVTNQSDFLTQWPYVTGVLLRTGRKQNTDGQNTILSRQSCPTSSQPQANRLHIREVEEPSGQTQSNSWSPMLGTVGVCPPHLGLHVPLRWCLSLWGRMDC